ncbi:Integrase [Vibrio crassostreae]|nr:Integrase [Vibrio crassostreae]
MLKFDHANETEAFYSHQKSIEGETDYLQDVLLPALLRGDWNELDKMIIYQDSKTTIYFGEDCWDYRKTELRDVRFSFKVESEEDTAVNIMRFKRDDLTLKNQIKCVVLARMYFTTEKVKMDSIRNHLWPILNHAKSMLDRNVDSFEALTIDSLKDLIDDGMDFSDAFALSSLNSIFNAQEVLPFCVNYTQLTRKLLKLDELKHEQHCVIPPRIYFAALNDFSADIEAAYANRDEIEKAVEYMVTCEQKALKESIYKIRHGEAFSVHLSLKSNVEFFEALEAKGVEIADGGTDKRWMAIYKKMQPTLGIGNRLDDFQVKIGETKYNWADLRRYLRDLNCKAAWLCMALSGMRRDELYRMHPNFGAQKLTFNVDRDDTKEETKKGTKKGIGKETIYFLTTRQSKITMNSQTKDDVFVTTINGFKAFYVLSAIHTPLRSYFPKKQSHRMFATLTSTKFPSAIGKEGLGAGIKIYFNKRHGFDLTLTSNDMKYLDVSDDTQERFVEGSNFHFTNHQLRRSLAFYLIGYELCSFPALKQQFGHFSMAMTRWYARNANSYKTFWNEVQDERISQQADIYVRIFEKMANGERVAGGKGKTYLKTIAKEGENYFEDGVNKRLLSRQYWIEKLRDGDEHLHAVAVGMYCSNDDCSMRLNIDLTECTDCEWDYIENVVYAEGARMDAMRNLNLLIEYNDLNSSSATKYYMQIKAAERIMTDLNFVFTPYHFEDEVLDLVIDLRTVA